MTLSNFEELVVLEGMWAVSEEWTASDFAIFGGECTVEAVPATEEG